MGNILGSDETELIVIGALLAFSFASITSSPAEYVCLFTLDRSSDVLSACFSVFAGITLKNFLLRLYFPVS